MAAGNGERIVHLYRWDSYDDAKQRLAAIVTPERMEYFIAARNLLLRQENAYLDRAPVAELSSAVERSTRLVARSASLFERRQRIRTRSLGACSGFSSRRTACVLGRFSQTERCDDGRLLYPFNRRLLCHSRQPPPHIRVSLAQELARGGGASPSACRVPGLESFYGRQPPADRRRPCNASQAEPSAVDARIV